MNRREFIAASAAVVAAPMAAAEAAVPLRACEDLPFQSSMHYYLSVSGPVTFTLPAMRQGMRYEFCPINDTKFTVQ